MIAAIDRRLLLLVLLGVVMSGCVSVRSSIGEPASASGDPGSGPVPSPSARAAAAPTSSSTVLASRSASRIGYIGLDEDLPYARNVAEGVRAEVEQAGLELVACDSRWSRDGALGCAEELAAAGVGGVISFQAVADASEGICETLGGVPVVGVIFDQGPCEVSRVAIDQAASGRLAGEAVGRFVRERWDCEANAWLALTSSAADPDGSARMQGYRDGFSRICPLPDTEITLQGADRVATAQTRVSAALDDLEGGRIIVVGLNEDAIIGAMRAATDADREEDLWYSGQLADPSIRGRIACDGHYIASVAQFPERFGALAVPALVDAMAGRPVPERMDGPLALVTAQNVRELFPGTRSCDE